MSKSKAAFLICVLLSPLPIFAGPIFTPTVQQIQGSVNGGTGAYGLPGDVLNSTTETSGTISTSGSGIDGYGRSYSGSARLSVDLLQGSLSFYSSGSLSGGISTPGQNAFTVTAVGTIYETYTFSGGPIYISSGLSTDGHGISTSGVYANTGESVANLQFEDVTLNNHSAGGCVIDLNGGSQTCTSAPVRLDNSVTITFSAAGIVNLLDTDESATIDYWGTVRLAPFQIYDLDMNPIGTLDLTPPSAASAPEPASLALLGIGLSGFGVCARRRWNSTKK